MAPSRAIENMDAPTRVVIMDTMSDARADIAAAGRAIGPSHQRDAHAKGLACIR
jgi:hypothetical protein